MQKKGVDISEFNGSVDFAALKQNHIDFVIIRCGYGGDYRNQDDSYFYDNVRKAEQNNMPYGVYLYSYAKNTAMARNEAEHTLRLLNGKKPLYGVWYDVEDSSISNCDLVTNCEVFCNAIQEKGLYCGIYSFLNWFETVLNNKRLDKYDKWVAQWSSSCDYKKPYGIWQFSDSGKIGSKYFDLNYAYKDYPKIIKDMEDDDMTQDKFNEMFRAAMASYLKNSAAKTAPTWAVEPMKWAHKNGIINGDSKEIQQSGDINKMRPEDWIKRDEVAVMMKNLYEVIEKE